MPILVKFIALFWTLAEMLIIFYLHLCISFIEGKRKFGNTCIIFCIALSGSLILILFLGEHLLGIFVNFNTWYNLYIYESCLWKFFCTLWAALEGIIMIYVMAIYRALKCYSANKGIANEDVRIAGFNFYHLNIFIILFFLTLYILYEYNLIFLVVKYSLRVDNFYNLSLLYRKICAVFNIIFDGGVAFLGYKTYSLLKKSEMDIL